MEPISPQQVKGYSQGGTVVDGIAYFTANLYQELFSEDGTLFNNMNKATDYPYVAAFDIETLKVVQVYPFADTYDSSPIVIDKKDGTRLLLAHEHEYARTVAMRTDTAEIEWVSETNQPGSMFFGYSYYLKKDGAKLVLASVKNGLHAMSLETGNDEWFVESRGGVTPCVDQKKGFIYYQTDGKLVKIDAETGMIVKTAIVGTPSSSICWNTIWAEDEGSCYVVTYWYSSELFGSAIRVYDPELSLIWEKKGLSLSKKATIAYHAGVLFAGCGDHWQKVDYLELEDDSWKKISAYQIRNGKVEWELDLREYGFTCIPNIIYCNGMLIAETQTNFRQLGYHIFVINAANGKLLNHYYNEMPANSCGVPLLSGGKWFSGDLVSDSVLVTTIGSGQKTNWIGAFGNGQTNDMCAPDSALNK
ncbi:MULTISPECIES: hypothetical protein [unclassified Paenibacillus]|uniref:hypothetical protein n=1 Tax=unclassified Paenibacillus TaxID=185978 RepID=UPI00363B7B8A